MKQLAQQTLAALERGERVVWCTILESVGSTPRGAGARMAVFKDGTRCGTVGGGAVEHQAIPLARTVLQNGQAHLRAFDLTASQPASIGMICGGCVRLYFQPLTPEELPTLRQLCAALRRNENAWISLHIADGQRSTSWRVWTQAEAAAAPCPARFTSSVVLEWNADAYDYYEPVCRAGRVWIFGGGHVGQALVPVLAGLDFRVAVYDDRPELADAAHFPQAEQVILGDYQHIDSAVSLRAEDYVIIMTHGHQADFALLEQVLRRPLFYVGCIGSRKKVACTQARLRAAGIAEEAIASVHSPIGLAIGAQTPAEIAISIVAELIQCRAGQAAPLTTKS